MATINTVWNRCGRPVCRRCINQVFHVNLQPRDCSYPIPYQQQCAVCGQPSNVVEGFRLTGTLKMLLK